MKGKRNLGKAVVLGLLLSTGMYGAAWADEESGRRDYGLMQIIQLKKVMI